MLESVPTVITTEECADCHHVFSRYADAQPEVVYPGRKKQNICPKCRKPVFVEIVRHPEQSDL